MSDEILIKNLDVVFHTEAAKVHAVRGVTLTLKPGKITGLVGETGSGKSVLAMSILRLLPDYAQISGEIVYQGDDLLKKPAASMQNVRRYEIGLIPQNPSEALNPSRRIAPQVRECFDGSRKAKLQWICNYLSAVGFHKPKELLSFYPYQLSGGMKQRVVSLFGMRDRLKWIIADEPTKGLDFTVLQQVRDSLERITRDRKKSMLVITHDLNLAMSLCDEVAVLYEGEIIERGTARDVFENPLHPYTAGLIKAMPQNGMNPMRPKGPVIWSRCPFYDRCPKSGENCAQAHPELHRYESDREVRCFLYDTGRTNQ